MAIKEKRYEANTPGKIFVDSECIDCDLCRAEVPEVFKRHADGYSFVFEQPKDEAVLERTVDVISACPVEAIGMDEEGQCDANI